MNKTDKKTLEEIIRVEHAGERGAIKIYEGQLLALKTFKQSKAAGLKGIVVKSKQHIFLDKNKCISFANKNKMFISVK